MNAPPSSDLALMLLADARLPIAGHIHSGGLEAAVADGMTAGDVPDYIATRLGTVVRIDAGASVVARHVMARGQSPLPVQEAWVARTPSKPLREVSVLQARALLRLLNQLLPDGAGLSSAIERPVRPLVAAAAALGFGLDPVALVRWIAYDDVQMVAAAALKLLALDPTTATQWVLDALPEIDRMAIELAPITSPDEIPSLGSPMIDAWAHQHSVASRRLFRA